MYLVPLLLSSKTKYYNLYLILFKAHYLNFIKMNKFELKLHFLSKGTLIMFGWQQIFTNTINIYIYRFPIVKKSAKYVVSRLPHITNLIHI